MTGRQLPASDYSALKAATRQLVITVGGAVAAAAVTRGDHQGISRYGSANPEYDERFMPVDVVADLESECEQPVVTRALATQAGFLLVPMPKGVGAGTALGMVTAKALKETSEVFVALADALGDGKVCAADARRVVPEIDEAIAKLAALKLQVQAEAEAGE